MKVKLLFLSFILLIDVPLLNAQSLFVMQKNGQQISYEISELAKIHFVPGVMFVNKLNEETDSYAMTELHYLSFVDLLIGIDEERPYRSAKVCSVFPNPARGMLCFKVDLTVKQRVFLEIFSLDGRKVCQESKIPEKDDYCIDISQLDKGVYLARLVCGDFVCVSKFVKE